MFYHVTFEHLVPSIMNNGLGGKGKAKRWSFSNDVVCMASNPDSAKKFANDVGWDEFEREHGYWGGKHVLLGINISPDILVRDRNCTDEATFEYAGVIPASQLTVIEIFDESELTS